MQQIEENTGEPASAMPSRDRPSDRAACGVSPLRAPPALALTPPQLKALTAARDKGGAIHTRGSRAGGAKRRMILRLVEMGLLGDCPPFPITDDGRAALARADRSEQRSAS